MPKPIVSLLNPNENYPQFSQDESFKEGLRKASEFFRNIFTVNARGMSRSYWAEDSDGEPPQPPSDLDILTQKSDLLECAKKLEGSRDVGTQLFCALLRSAGVETRLVCSLQVLPMIGTAKGPTPQKSLVKPIQIIDYDPPSSENDSDQLSRNKQRSSPIPSTRPIGSTGGLTRFSNPDVPQPTSSPLPRPPPRSKSKRFRQSPYPVYWLEVFNPFSQRYVPLDTLVTHTIGKPSALTPPLSDPLNSLTYVIAFNDDLTAKDVTKRYTRAYNAKILKQRIDLLPKGKDWLSSVLALFQYQGRGPSPKDESENVELAKKEASEPMPRNIQDFKNHPIYALERHLHRNEIIHPKQEIGRVSTGMGSKNESKLEPVFRRRDVLTCRTADQWFRMGREVREGEQPLKRLIPSSSSKRTRRSPTPDEDGSDAELSVKTLYALHQTTLYVPPPIPERGYPIPRNAFSNLDVYVPSMIPARGWHCVHPLTSIAAKLLGIDHVPAVTGFTFSGGGKGRSRGSATVTGAVVWEGHREAVEAVIGGLENQAKDEEDERWKATLWGMWRKMIRGLRVRERVRGYQIEGEDAEGEDSDEVMDESEKQTEEDDEGGGFLPEQGVEEAMPTARLGREKRGNSGRKVLLDSESEDDDVYVPSEGEENPKAANKKRAGRTGVVRTGPDPVVYQNTGQAKRDDLDDGEAGGFLLDDADDSGGGFIPDNERGTGGGFVIEEDPAAQNPGSQPLEQGAHAPTAVSTLPKLESAPSTQTNTDTSYQHPLLHPPAGNPAAPDISLPQPNLEEGIVESATPLPFGGLSEEEIAEARMLEEFYASGKARDDKGSDTRDTSAPPEGATKAAVDEDHDVHEELTLRGTPLGAEATESAEEEDKGSLLSEDPSDEDAEPEWLA